MAYRALFPADSTFAAGALQFWAGEGEKGRFYRPGRGGAMLDSTLLKVVASAAAEVTFTVCTARSQEIVDSAGVVLEAQGGVNGGEITVVLVDGQWLLRDLTRRPPDGCPTPGSTP